MDLSEGQTLAGKYLLVRQLGEGGMCVVYEAEHVGLRQGLALKILKSELADDADCVARFEREARAAAQLRSLNVAKVFDVDYLPGGRPYITMELLVGHDLGQELHDSGRLSIELAVDYVRQACTGIAEAHALGIVHRDLKPENLFLTELGELTDRKLLKILDFGIAKNVSDNARRLTAPDAVFGTVDYMSPEQIRSASTVDHRTDLWSLGVILYELLTGRTPYEGDARAIIAQIVSEPIRPPTVLVPELPRSLVATVMKALHKDPDQRFQSAEDLRAALHGYGEFEPITSVIARLPPQSVPRRGVRTSPSLQGVSSSAAAETARDRDARDRDARTQGSWETKAEPRSWGKAWILMSLIATIAGSAASFLYWRGHGLPWRSQATAGGEAPAVTALPTAPPPVSAAPPVPPAPAITAVPPLAASSVVLDIPAPGDSATGGAKAVKKPTRAAPPAPPGHPPPPTTVPSPAPPTPASRIPKHI